MRLSLQAAGALEAVVAKFPAPLLAARAELLFLPLAARLVNDPSAQCVTCNPVLLMKCRVATCRVRVGPGSVDLQLISASQPFPLLRALPQTLHSGHKYTGVSAAVDDSLLQRHVPSRRASQARLKSLHIRSASHHAGIAIADAPVPCRCRAAVGGVLKALWAAVDPPAVDRLVRYMTDWLGGTDPRLQRTASQVGLDGKTLTLALVQNLVPTWP